MESQTRPLHEIADDISENWEKPYFGAVPYLQALRDLNTIDEDYGADSARSIVLYFLANAQSFRGPEARRIKKELKGLLGN